MIKRRRRQFREIEVVECLILQEATIPCYRCGIPFTIEDVRAKNIQKEHLHEFNLDGPDVPGNCRFSHAAAPCHHTVTNGPPATSAGSSKNRLAKANNPGRTQKFVVQKSPLPVALITESWTCGACGEYGHGAPNTHHCPKRQGPKIDQSAIWSIRVDNGWCATADGRKPSNLGRTVATACGKNIIVPCTRQKHFPTCAECRGALKAGADMALPGTK